MLLITISDIRLIDGGEPNRGRVEIFIDEIGWGWTAVCNSLDSITADIACRQLGFPNASFSFQGGSYEAYDEIEHVVEVVICYEDQWQESRLQDCYREWRVFQNLPQTGCWGPEGSTQAWLVCEHGKLQLRC